MSVCEIAIDTGAGLHSYPHMDDLLTPSDVEQLAAANGRTIADLCRAAGIAHSTFRRWARGQTEPTLSVYRRIRDAAMRPPGAPTPADPREAA